MSQADDTSPPGETGDVLAPGLRLILRVLEGPDAGTTMEIDKPVVTVGRGDVDLRLTDPSVSSRHFAVEVRRGEAWLRDLGTTNGTLVNGDPSDQVVLHTRDEIQAGRTRLVFQVGPRSRAAANALAAKDDAETRPTSVALDPHAAGLLDRIPRGMPADGTVRDGAHDFQPKVGVMRTDTVVFLEILSGPDSGNTFNLSQPGVYLIGRSNGEIPLTDEKCSTKHAQIQILADDQYFLTDLASTNGTFLNDIRTSRRRLKHMDTIRIGDSRLRFTSRQGAVPLSG
jgi:pSer/pThr/pTyr-binding forkhead associated (FHA) protein